MIAITLLPELSKLLKTRGPRKRSFLCSSPILRRVKPTLKQPSEMAWRRQRTNGRPLFFNKIKKHLFNSCERFITKKTGTSRALRISQMRRNREAVIAHGNGRSKIDDILILYYINFISTRGFFFLGKFDCILFLILFIWLCFLFKLLFNISSLLFNRRFIETKNNNTFLSNLEVCYKIAFTILNTYVTYFFWTKEVTKIFKNKKETAA